MNYREESGSRETRTLSPGLLTMIVKIRLKHVSYVPYTLSFHNTACIPCGNTLDVRFHYDTGECILHPGVCFEDSGSEWKLPELWLGQPEESMPCAECPFLRSLLPPSLAYLPAPTCCSASQSMTWLRNHVSSFRILCSLPSDAHFLNPLFPYSLCHSDLPQMFPE